MKKRYKVWSLLLVITMLASMMTAMTVGAVDIKEIEAGYYTSIIGPVTNESDSTKLGTGSTNMGTDIACSYVTEGENTFVNASRTAYTSNKKNFIYPYDFGSDDFAFDLGSGEYVVQTKVRWTQTDGLTKPANAFFFRMEPTGGGVTYAISNKNYGNTGFGVGDTTEDYIWQGDTKAKLSDGTTNATIQLQNNTWYTVRVVYNLDEENDQLITRMEIDDANGTNLITTQNATMECTDPLKFYRVYSNIFQQATTDTGHVDFAIDDFMIVKLVKKPVVENYPITVTYDETKGTVSYKDAQVKNGEKVEVASKENALFTIASKEGYAVDEVLVDGKETTLSENSTVTIPTVESAHTLQVIFKEEASESEEAYNYIIKPIDNTIRKIEGTFASKVDSITVSFPNEQGNDYWYAIREDGGSLNNPGVRYPSGDGSFASDNGKTVLLTEDGTYIVQAKMMFDALGTTAATHNFYSNIKVDGSSVLKNYSISGTFGDKAEESIVDLNSAEIGKIDLEFKKWYTIRFVYKLNNKTAKSRMEIDSEDGTNLLKTSETEFNYETSVQILRLVTELLGDRKAETTLRPGVAIDDFMIAKVVEKAPVVASVTIDGAVNAGQTLTANAVVTDVNPDDVVSAQYQWQVLNGAEWKDITGATEKTYKIPETMIGKQLRVNVTPKSSREPVTGKAEPSEATDVVGDYIAPPTASDASISGDFTIGSELTATFTYTPSEEGTPRGESVYIWETSATEGGTYSPVQTSTEDHYKIKMTDIGKWLRVRVIPKDQNGIAGETTVSEAFKVEGKLEFFVSVNGNDENEGSYEKPFATIQKARDTIRSMDLPEDGVTVNIMGGTYSISEPISFTKEDSGQKDAPIIYQAYNGENVSFIGGKVLNTSKIQKVTDETMLNRLIEEDAKSHLYMLDLGAQDVDMDVLPSWGRAHSRIFMNNNMLTEARWPNDDQSQMLVKCRPLTAARDGIDEDKYNTSNTPIMFEYPDPENRSERWTIKKGDAYVGGAIAHFWASANLRIDNVDPKKKVVTSMDKHGYATVKGVGWGPQYKVFFANIFEEIDKPGESYIDRENDILYFYPIGTMETPKLVVSTYNKNMISLNEVSYVQFKGIDFKETIETPVVMTKCDNIRFEDGEVSNTTAGGMVLTDCTNTVISGCNFYTTASSPVSIVGGDRVSLTPSGNVIENNIFHNTCYMASGQNARAALGLRDAVGEIVRNNEFNDMSFGAMHLKNCNDILIEYNKILNAGQNTTDAGSIYWGREYDSLGHTIRYNYFENIGSALISNYLNSPQSVGVFIDDAATGGNIYGNVFLNAGAKSQGRGSSTAGNGPEFTNVWGNISICTEFEKMNSSYQMRNWESTAGMSEFYGVKVPEGIAAASWLYMNQMRKPYGGSNSSNDLSKMELLWSDAWKQHYKNTQWEDTLEHYSKENYEGAKALFDKQDYAGVLNFLGKNLTHERTNKIHDNVSLGAIVMDSLADHYQNFNGTQGAITAEDKALFVDFDNKDFTLTKEGLAKIQKAAPEFKEIKFNQIGLKSDVGGSKPVVTVNDEIITGVAVAGNAISPSYTFIDADGDLEGNTKVYWYVSNTADGKFEKLYGVEGKNFKVTDEYSGRYLKYEIVPYDATLLRADSVWSDAILIEKADNALLSDLKVNGETIKKFAQNKFNYMVSLSEMPEITVETAVRGAKVEITRTSDTLPSKFIITVTAADGKTTQSYQVSVTSTATTPPTVSPTVSPTIKPTIKPPTTGFGGGGGGIAGVSGNQQKEEETEPVRFTDIIGHWAENDINEMADKGIVSGVTATTFEPDRSITRAEFAALMARALGLNAANDDAVFADVASDAWYKDAVSAAAAAGLIVGYDGKFRPNDTITREEMAVVIMKAYKFLGKSPLNGKIDQFDDKASISEWAVDYVDGAVSSGLISGMSEDTFAPKENATRAQVASLIKRLLNH